MTKDEWVRLADRVAPKVVAVMGVAAIGSWVVLLIVHPRAWPVAAMFALAALIGGATA